MDGGIKMQLHFQWPHFAHSLYLLSRVDFSLWRPQIPPGLSGVMFPCKYCRGRAKELTVTKQICPYKVGPVDSSKSGRATRVRICSPKKGRRTKGRSVLRKGQTFVSYLLFMSRVTGKITLNLPLLIRSLIHNGERFLELTSLFDTFCIGVCLSSSSLSLGKKIYDFCIFSPEFSFEKVVIYELLLHPSFVYPISSQFGSKLQRVCESNNSFIMVNAIRIAFSLRGKIGLSFFCPVQELFLICPD